MKRIQKIAYLITGLTIGGAEMQLLQVVTKLDRQRFQPFVISMMDKGEIGEKILQAGIAVYELKMKKGLPSPVGVLRLIRILRRERPCVLHCHMYHANLLGAVIGALLKIPVRIATVHSISLGGKVRRILAGLTSCWMDAYTVISGRVAQKVLENRIAPPSKIRVIPNGVDTEVFSPSMEIRKQMREQFGIPEEKFIWFTAGRIVEAKNYPGLLSAFRQVVGTHPHSWLMIAGDGPLSGSLRKYAQSLEITGHVKFLGIRRDIPSLMKMADGFVMASSWEGLPMAVLEAGASCLPVVSTNVGGIPEVVNHGKTGLLADANDMEALSQAMAKVMDMPEDERRKIGQNARAYIVEQYGIKGMVKRWESLYRELIREKGMDKIKVAHAATIDGSIHGILSGKLKGLIEKGYEIHAISSPGRYEDKIRQRQIHFHPILIKRNISPFHDMMAILKMIRLFRKEKFHIVHTHTAKAGFVGRVAATLAGVPVIVHTSHGLPFYEGQGFLQFNLYKVLEKVASKCCHAVFSQNHEDMEIMKKYRIASADRIHYEGNGVNVRELDRVARLTDPVELRERLGLHGRLVIGYYARLESVKGHLFFLKGFKAAADRFEGAVCLMAGEGPMEEPIRDAINKLGLNGQVRLLGFREDIPSLLTITDILVLTSKKEGIPRVVMEAMALGVPVIATNVLGNRELIRDRETGLLVPYGDEKALGEALTELMGNPEMRHRYGSAGRKRIEAYYLEEQAVDRIHALYQALLQQKGL